jgi:small subunit ribosomal protein S8
MMTDPIADMITRIKNALAINKVEVVLPYSKLKAEVAKILEKNGYILGFEKMASDTSYTQLKIKLKYLDNKPAISQLRRVSKPGRRVYAQKDNLPIVLNNLGVAIVSTSRGLMTNKEAKKVGLGGEVICEVY